MMALAEELKGKQQIVKDRISILNSESMFDDSSDEIDIRQFTLASSPPPTILFDHHSALLTITQTCLAVFMKCFPAFIAFVINDYEFTYSFVTRALAIGSLSTMICIIVLPQLLYFRANIAFFFICIIGCIGTFILWYFRHNDKAFFILGLSLIFNAFQLQWGASNATISSFVNGNDKDRAHKYLSSLSAGWTYATFLFIGVGFILKYETFDDYLAWMFVILSVLAVLNLIMLPKVSVNKYNQMHYNKSAMHISIRHDLKILFSLKKYRFIIVLLAFSFTSWSYIYTSFGYWIQNLYHLNQAELGIAAALIEGIGNLAAILLITYVAMTNNNCYSEINNSNRYKLKLQNMMIYFALFLLLSVTGILIINYVDFFKYLLNFKFIVYGLICIYFFGSEGVIVGALILSVTETPKLQQARSSAIISITNSICLFIGQFTVGYVYEDGGFKLETPILLSIQIMLVFVTIYLSYVMRKYRLNPELISINKNSYSLYT